MERSKVTAIAVLSPSLAWYLLTPAERQLVLDYLAKVLEKEEEPRQEERQLTLVKV